ncbi:2OG-Fe(II) oxygenase [Rubrivirga marina]|uniref:2OG-Fe(II) oxygenase n=1 Tax=Rubrivirga marina TaxID=1196024 RepID=A0A271J5P0_9BACT|nr:2OG-Fe(II) oxygenase [Rubrivirga marina]
MALSQTWPTGATPASSDAIADALAESGWAVTPGFLTGPEAASLLAEGHALRAGFHRAGIGRGGGHQVAAQVRGDEVLWLDEQTESSAQRRYLDRMAELQAALNQALFLGLFSYETHFAVYPPGAFYKRHLDAFHGSKGRTLSCVLYLNPAWTDADGGHLRLYLDGEHAEPYVDVRPEAGTLVTFLSERFEHEVLPATRERASVTGWYSVRT